jgi:hypothetical protein
MQQISVFVQTLVAIFILLDKSEGAADFSFEIVGRPGAVRPIPGETVRFTCSVESSLGLSWSSNIFTNELRFFTVDDVGDQQSDEGTNAVAYLTEKGGGNFSSVLNISSLEASIHNNSLVECSGYNEGSSSNFTIVMAGIPSPPVDPEHFNNTCLCANISWAPPIFDGAAPITHFTITLTLPAHTLPNSSVSVNRVEIADGNATQIDVCDLRPNAVYNTTITSHNAVGTSRAEDFVILINATEPYPALNLVARPVCANHRRCLFNDSDHLLVTWELPKLNSLLLCPVEQTWLNYSFLELEVYVQSFQITAPYIGVTDTSFEIRPVTPGTTYNVTVTFVNEVGESTDNTVAIADVLLFQNYLFQKRSEPFSLFEGRQAEVYTVRLDGPPPNEVAITVNPADDFLSVERPVMFEYLVFNADNWFVAQDILVSAIDDDVILESPYGSLLRVVDMEMTEVNLTLLVSETDLVDVLIIPRETYPSFRHIPEGRWSVFNVTLPSQPYYNVTITFHPLNPTIYLSHVEMIFQPSNWNVPQILTVFATEDDINAVISPYSASFNLSLTSRDYNYDGADIDDYEVTVEDNDDDSAVLAGSLTWVKLDSENRTTAQFSLTLSLSHSQYPSSEVGDRVYVTGSVVEYGDGETTGDGPLAMKVVAVNTEEDYILATTHLLHTYPTTSSHGQPWEAVFRYCCRAQDIRNNPDTWIVLSVGVDLTYASSPLIPSLPPVTLYMSQGTQGFFFTSTHPNFHPLVFSLGTTFDYMSSQAGTPQTLRISHSTGHVTCDTDHMTPGDYSVMIAVEDTISGIRVVSEIRLKVKLPVPDDVPPAILAPHPILPPPPLVFSQTTTNHTLLVRDEDTIMAAEVHVLSNLPEGAELSRFKIRGDKTGEVSLSWIPSEDQIGVYIACFVAMDMYSTSSTPYCVSVIATSDDKEFPIVDSNGPLANGLTFTQSYAKGVNESVPLVSGDATISTPSYGIHYMSIALANSPDGSNENLVFSDYFEPSVSYQYTQPPSNDYSSVLVIKGTATPAIYSEILRNLRYVNNKGRPTVGERILYLVVSDGDTANDYTVSYTTIDVSIDNIAPVLSASGTDEAFDGLFFPFEGPVPVINPLDAYVIDTDSEGIEGATLELGNVQDGEDEVLGVTYKSPERLSLPIIAEAVDLDIPFGILWDGEEAPAISSIITVGEDSSAAVGEVKVVVNVRHSWVGDLSIELEHNSLRKQLVLNPGGQTCQKDDLFLTTFSSYFNSQTDPPSLSRTAGSPGVCVLRSQGVFTTDGDIQFFHGMSIGGEWVLHVTDNVLDEYSGRLAGWSLIIQPLETHLVESYPPVLPPLSVSGESGYEERRVKKVTSDGRIAAMAVHVHLGVPHTAEFAFLPSLVLVHPDGTEVTLAHGIDNLCARGNYTHLIFDDRAQSTDYSCFSLLQPQTSGSGFSGSSSGRYLVPGSGTEAGYNAFAGSASGTRSGSGVDSGGSGIGSGSGWILYPENTVTFGEAVVNITTFPTKLSMVDLLAPITPLHVLRGKRLQGEWSLVLSSQHSLKSTLFDWSLRIAREPNIDATYDASENILTLSGLDSPSNYQSVLRSIVYENKATDYEFLTPRTVTTTVFDGELYSDSTTNASKSYVTLHHIVLDLDPADLSNASTPDFSIRFIEHSSSVAILDQQRAILTDPTFSEGLYTLTITLTGYQNHNEENLTVDMSVSPDLRAQYANNIPNDEFTVTITSINSTLRPIELYEAVMRTVEYHNFAEEFVGSTRSVEFVATDAAGGSRFTSRVATAHITLSPTNDFAVLQLNAYQYGPGSVFSNVVEYQEGEGAVLLANASSVVFTDNDHTTLERVTVTIQNAQDGEMEILFANTEGFNVVARYNRTTNVLLLSGRDTLENYAQVIGTVTYNNTFHSPGQPGTDPRYISFVPYDGTHEGYVVTALVTFSAVNDAPFGDLNGPARGINFSTSFTEERGPANIASSNLMLFDIDNTTLSYITVRITNNIDGHLETLSVMDVLEETDPDEKVIVLTFLRPETSYDSSSATLTISGLDSVREYQEVLSTLAYNNTADEPNPDTRVIEVIMSDGKTESNPLYIHVEIELVNDSPYFNLTRPAFGPEILEDVPVEENGGTPVSEIAYLIVDDDVGAQKGVAIVQLDTRNGEWEFTLNSGDTWTSVDSVNRTSALVLEALVEQRVRFVPNQDFNGDVGIAIVAWDKTNEGISVGTYTDATSQSSTDPFSDDTLLINLFVIPVNDAPVLLNIPLNATSIREDDYNATGDTVLSLLTFASDVDYHDELGVAVTAANQENGVWQYTTDGGENWEMFGSVGVESALLLRSLPEEDNRIRFVPDLDFNGYVSIDLVAWDLTRLPEGEIFMSGSADASGKIAVMSSSSGSGSGFSSASGYKIPSGSGSDSASGSGYRESVDSSVIGPVSPNVTLPEPYPVGSYINTSLADEVTAPFSVNSTSLTLWIEPVNDSPVISPGMTLDGIMEDLSVDINHGMQVSRIISGYYNDVDANADTGLAVIGVDNRFGLWEYTCDSPSNPSSWEAFIGDIQYNQIVPPLPLQDKATLLLSTCWIRYLPSPNFNNELDTDGYPRPDSDAPYIRVLGWDNTGRTFNRSGTYGNDATYAHESIINEYSINPEQVFITVLSRNDKPVLGLTSSTVPTYSAVFLEDRYPVEITGEGLSLIDVDHARLRDVTVTIYGSVYDQLPQSLASIDFGISVSGDYSSTSGSGSSSGSGFGQSGSASGSASVSGNDSFSSESDDFESTPTYPPFVPMVTSAPQLPPLHRIREYVENLSNPTELQRYCAGLEPRSEELFIDVSKWDLEYRILSWCPFTLYIYADPKYANDAPVDQFRLALGTLRYNNSIDEPEGGNRTISFVVSDNFNTSDVVSATVTVVNIDDSPILDLNENVPTFNNFVSYTEGQGPLLLANESISLMDHDHQFLQGARIVLQNAPDEDHEVLAADTTNTTITAEYTNYTLYLRGNAAVATYRDLLATVTYNNTYANPGNPAAIERQVYFYVSDGELESDPAVAYISFTAINNRPHLFVGGPQNYTVITVTFVEEKGPVFVVNAGDLLLHDEDNSSVSFVTARILNNQDGIGEYLTAENITFYDIPVPGDPNSVVRNYISPNITYNIETAELYISGLDSIDEYELILRTIQYNNLVDEPISDTRIVEFIANDGLLNSEPVYTEVVMEPENDSPRFNDSELIISDFILEDDTDNAGISVFEFAYFLIEDDDVYDERGIAIIDVDTENGAWQFRTGGMSEWAPIRKNTSITTALLLRADMNFDNFLRFVPNQDFNGNASLTFLPWDATDSMPDGDTRVAISQSGLDPFGEETMELVVQVIPVNDAPVLHDPPVVMTTILEDDVWERESYGDDISLFLSALSDDVDVEILSEAHFGIAIIGVDDTNGHWEVSVTGGMNWTDIESPSLSSAVVMQSQPEGENRIRFVPNRDFNGESSFQYLLWDLNVTWPSGTQEVDTTIQDRVTGTFSTTHTTTHVTIEPVNDSPVLIENGGIALSRIREDTDPSLNFGTAVEVILRDHFEDIDGQALGLAVVHVDERNGRWWYTCQTGTNIEWNLFIGGHINYETEEGTVSQISPLKPNEYAATLLDGICSIRFLPDEHFNTEYNYDGSPRDVDDTPYITIRGWDQTEGASMDITVNTSTTPDNHTNSFSAEIFRATIEVVHNIDAPVLQLDGTNDNYQAIYVEPVPPNRKVVPVPVVNPEELRLTDPDNATLSRAVISFTQLDPGDESLLVDVSGTNLIATNTSDSDVFSISISPAGDAQSAPIEDFETVLRTVQYQNVAEEPNPDDRTILFFVNDGLTASDLRTTTLSIRLVNDPPELDLNIHLSGTFSIVGYSEGEGAASLLNPALFSLIDYDNRTLLDHAWVNITNPYDMRYEMLAVGAPSPNISASVEGSLLYLRGPASVEEFRDVIASVTYENTFSEPGDPSGLNRTIAFVVNDGLDDSIPAVVYLLFTVVNNAPFLDLNGGHDGDNYNTVFYEEQGPVAAVSQSLTIQDIDNASLAFIEVRIANPRDGGEQERLWVEDVTVTIPPETETRHVTYITYTPTQYYNETTSTLRVTGLETVMEFELILKTLKYDNLADEPNSETRELYITVSDGLLDTTAISLVEIINVNDSPFFNNSATLFTSQIAEDVHNFNNPGWAIEDIVAGLILDDDTDSKEGIAIIAADSSNGHWEITWDYGSPTYNMSGSGISSSGVFSSSSGSAIQGSGSASAYRGISSGEGTSNSGSGLESEGGAMGSGEGSPSEVEDFDLTVNSTDTDYVIYDSGSGVDSGSGIDASGSSSYIGSGSSNSGSGSGYLGSGSGSGSGPIGPKCIPTVRQQAVPVSKFSATWHSIPPGTSLSEAVLLSSNGQRNRIRFVPNRDFNGRVDFTFVAWDTTDGAVDGETRDAVSVSAIDSFSSEAVVIEIIVDPVNDAPLLPTNSTLTLSSILEDDYQSPGDDVSTLTGIITDVDVLDSSFGIAVVEADEENGQWEISTNGGVSWTAIVSVCPYNATVLSSVSGENRIQFVPNRDFNGIASFVFLAWDLTSDLQSGDPSVDTTSADLVTGPFSVTSATATITVEPVNDSPVLSPDSHLHAIPEDLPVGENRGTLVSDIVREYYYDVDVGAESGIAVVGVDLRFGIWQYRCPNSDWETFIGNLLYGMYVVPPLPQIDRATALGGDCRIRFLPDEHFNTLRDINGYLRPSSDTPYITIRAWDNTGISEGRSGQYGVDTTYNTESITNEFSSETETATVEVVSVNDVPVIRIAAEGDGIRLLVNYTENQPFVRLVGPNAVSVTDIDHAELESVTISVINTLDGDAEVIKLELANTSLSVSVNETTQTAYVTVNGRREEVMLSQNTFSDTSSSLTLSAPVTDEKVSIEAYEELLRHVVYTNLLEEPSNATRIVRFYINDSEDVNSLAETSVQFELLNEHTPVVNDSLTSVDFAEDTTGPVSIASTDLTVTDTDHNEYFFIHNATIAISPVPENQNEHVSVNISSLFLLTQEYDPLAGVLRIVGRAPPMVYQTALQTAVYENRIEETRPGVREIAFQVFDGSYYSEEHIVRVNIILQNDQHPVITTFNETFVFLEHSEPLSLNANLTVSDADSGSQFQVLQSLHVSIANAYDGAEEELAATQYGNVSVDCEGTLCRNLTLSGPAPISEFQDTLFSLTYANVAEEPTPGVRHIYLLADDGMLRSETSSIFVSVVLVNDVPVIDLNGPISPGSSSAINYIEGLGEVLLAPNVTLTDNDHQELQMVTVRIVNVPDGESEILSVATYNDTMTNTSSANITTLDLFNISVEYNASLNVLILSGASNLSNYQTLLQTITYDNYEAMPGFPNTDVRMVEFLAFDGTGYSNSTIAYVTFHSVNDSPIVDLNGAAEGQHNVEFIEEGEPVLITTSDLVLIDVDNQFLDYLEISIMNQLDGDYEVLAVNESFTDESLIATYIGGTLMISGLGLVDNFRSALASVTYQNLIDEPDYTPRVVSVVANDGQQDSSPQYVTVNITAVNDPPRLFITGLFNPPPPTPSPPISSGSGSGTNVASGSGLGSSASGIDPGSGSGIDIFGDQSGSGSGSVTSATDDGSSSVSYGSGAVSGASSGSGMVASDPGYDPNIAPGPGMRRRRESDQIYEYLDDLGIFFVMYPENSLPLSIVNRSEVTVEDDDDLILTRLEITLNGVQDPGYETIFFDINLLQADLVSKLGEAGAISNIGDGNTCPPGLPFVNEHTLLDVNIIEGLSLADWEEVVRSIKYCHSDEDPVGGTRNVSFRIQDPNGAWSNVVYAFIEVIADNDAPLCSDTLSTYEILEDANVTIPGLSRCFDYEENLNQTSVVIHRAPTLGSAEVQSSGDILYTPFFNLYGSDSFAYVVCDSLGICSEVQSVSIAIASVNDPPYPEDNLVLSIMEDTRTLVDLSQFFGDYEDDLIPQSTFPEVQTATEFTIGSLTQNGSTAFYFDPMLNYVGEGRVRLTVCDSENVCVSILVRVVVLPVNDLPIFETPPEGSDELVTVEDTPLRIEISVFDIEDRSELNVSFASAPNGTGFADRTNITFDLVPSSGASDYFKQTLHIVYIPNKNFDGTDYVTIAAVDSEGGYNETTIPVEVRYVNDPPEFGLTQLLVVEDKVTEFELPSALQITDPEQELHAGSFSIIEPPSLGNITFTFNETHLTATGSYPSVGYLTYYPPEHYFTSENETIPFLLEVCDNDTLMDPLCTIREVHIVILSVNDAPHLPVVLQSVYEDRILTFNLSDYTSDVEDGKPSLDNIFLTDPYPTRGAAVYDNTTGFLTYTPFFNTFGQDIVHYNACDSENHCSPIKGQVIVDILQVNDPPTSEDFLHIAIEDDFDLIGFEERIYDNETSVLGLRLGIRGDDYSETSEYLNRWVTPTGGSLRVYHAHQIITYEPPLEFVGTDSFTYSVCDLCDSRRDEELGRVDQEPHCARQVEENGGSHLFEGSDVFITCSESTVTVRITNINDVPQARDISGTTQTRMRFIFSPLLDSLRMIPAELGTGYLYSDPTAAIFDSDDLQSLRALERGDNLTLFNLEPTTDIDEMSLVLKSQPTNGIAVTTIVDGRVQIEYTPNDDFEGGYDEVVYEICDIMREDAPPRCAEADARVFVTREGPSITSVAAHGFTIDNILYSDSKVSAGDVITIGFSDDTNMPPYGNTESILSTSDIDEMFEFSDPHILADIAPNGYTGQWDSPTQLNITLNDVGYPQPFVFNASSRDYYELRTGEWTVNLRPHPGPCGGFDIDGQPVVVDRSCLLSADETAQPVDFTSPALTGNFGLRMPELQTVLLESIALDVAVLDTNNVEEIFLSTHIILRLIEPLSYAQLQLYCSSDPNDILNTDALAESITLIVDGCANILPDGSNADQYHAENLNLIADTFSVSKRKRSVEEQVRERRQIQSIQPVQSEIILQILSIENPRINPIEEPGLFYRTVAESLNYDTIASVISRTMGIPLEALVRFKSTSAPLVNPGDGFFYYAHEEDLTPEIVNVVADDPDNSDQVYGGGDTITITFNTDSDTPPVGTKDDLDRIFVFDPPLGTNYEGKWLDPRTLEITILQIDGASTNYPSAAVPGPVRFSLSFTPNYLHTGDPVTSDNENFPTTVPSCIGVNVCGSSTADDSSVQSVGICDTTQRSCRAHEIWTSLDGDFGTGSPEPTAPFPWWYILIAIIVVILIAVTVVVFYFMWRNHSRRAQAKEARRVLSRWKEDRGAPGKNDRKVESPKPWQGPPAPAAMRSLPDPFAKDGPMGKLPDVVRPPTAITEVEHLPPIPQPPRSRSNFIPRTPARIYPAPPSLQSVPPAPRSRTLSSPATLQQLGLPPLTKMPSQQETPNRLDRRSVLPPVKGGLVSLQARRALATEQDTFGPTSAAMPDRPSRLLPLGGAGLFGPTKMPDKPLHLAPIGQPVIGKGKAPAGVRPLLKKGAQQSSEEEGVDGDTKPNLPTLPTPLRPLPKQPLPGIGGSPPRPSIGGQIRPLPGIGSPPKPLPGVGSPPKPLPAISMRTPLPSLKSPTTSMPQRKIAPDPFTTGLTGTTGLGSPAKMTPAPLNFPPPRLSLSSTRSPGGVNTIGPLSPVFPPGAKLPKTLPSAAKASPKPPVSTETSPPVAPQAESKVPPPPDDANTGGEQN